MNRYTFVVQIHPEGISTLENLNTHERVRLSDIEEAGPQIKRWLGELEELSELSSSSRIPLPAPDPSSPASPPG